MSVVCCHYRKNEGNSCPPEYDKIGRQAEAGNLGGEASWLMLQEAGVSVCHIVGAKTWERAHRSEYRESLRTATGRVGWPMEQGRTRVTPEESAEDAELGKALGVVIMESGGPSSCRWLYPVPKGRSSFDRDAYDRCKGHCWLRDCYLFLRGAE